MDDAHGYQDDNTILMKRFQMQAYFTQGRAKITKHFSNLSKPLSLSQLVHCLNQKAT